MAKDPRCLYVSFLGGVGEIGKNMTAIEYGDEIIIVDCGVSFPDYNYPGLDAIIPDITYIRQNIKKIKGIVLTHGHEDHMGAIQYYIDDFKNIPIYGTSLTTGLVLRKIGVQNKKMLHTISAGDTVELGSFKVEFIKVTHSMAGACALNVKTPLGSVFVTGDYKFDKSPIDNKKTNVKRISEIGKEGVLLMLGESTNIERKGSSTSEQSVYHGLDAIFKENSSKRIIVACFSSSNYRIQQVLWLAKKYGRKVVLAGSSMKGVVDVASNCGELDIPKGIFADSISQLKPNQTVILATGSQGEPLSALNKMSNGEFPKFTLSTDDLVVLSSSPIPGNEKDVYDVINKIYKFGASCIYDAMNDIHVSGHAYEDELKYMLSLVKPEYFLPVHGEYRHQAKHIDLARESGVKFNNVDIPEIGDSFAVSKKGLALARKIPAGEVYVDNHVLEKGAEIIQDRKNLASYGMLMILCAVNTSKAKVVGQVELVKRGIELTADQVDKINDIVRNVISNTDFNIYDVNEASLDVKKTVRKIFYKDRRFPVIIPVLVEA